jgi:predicted acetyltransferase
VALVGTPSQSTIYGRFGHGPVCALLSVRIETHGADFERPLPGCGRLRDVDIGPEYEAVCSVYDRYRLRQPGEVTRSAAIWDFVRADNGDSHSPLFWVMYQSAEGVDEGYVAYQIVERCLSHHWERILQLRELVSTTSTAHAALWRFCLDMDLVAAVEGWIPYHDPVRWLLADQRRLEVRGYVDPVWMRPIDLASILEARGYSTPDTITLHIVDNFLQENTGCYTITGEATGGAVVRRTGSDGDLSLGVGQLATLIFGASQFITLAAADLVEENTRGALHRADAMFSTAPPPTCITPI